jgi:hypothetical protein
MSSADRSRHCESPNDDPGERHKTTIDHKAEEALRSLVRVLARQAAQELFATTCVAVDNQSSCERPT